MIMRREWVIAVLVIYTLNAYRFPLYPPARSRPVVTLILARFGLVCNHSGKGGAVDLERVGFTIEAGNVCGGLFGYLL